MFMGVTPTILRPLSVLSAILKPQDVFATSLYTGTGANQKITNGLDLAGKGGLSWFKSRASGVYFHNLIDTVRGASNGLSSNSTAAENTVADRLLSFASDGLNLGPDAGGNINVSGQTFANWSFARAAKFFDIVTWTGDGTSNRLIPHALGVVPGMVIVKSRGTAQQWATYHRSLGATKYLFLDSAQSFGTSTGLFPTDPTSSAFFIGASGEMNQAGAPYVAYLFAHDPSADGIVQCGTVTGPNVSVALGWSPQFLMLKQINGTGDWFIVDTTRGWASGVDKYLCPNTSAAETTFDFGAPTSTGFDFGSFAGQFIYLAIRAPY